jgi:hypothetical protein
VFEPPCRGVAKAGVSVKKIFVSINIYIIFILFIYLYYIIIYYIYIYRHLFGEPNRWKLVKSRLTDEKVSTILVTLEKKFCKHFGTNFLHKFERKIERKNYEQKQNIKW